MEIYSTLLNGTGAIGACAIFIFYLKSRDKNLNIIVKDFNNTIKDFNKTVGKHIGENSRALNELKHVIEQLYIQNKDLVEKNKKIKVTKGLRHFNTLEGL